MNSLPKTVTRQRRDCDLNPGSSAPESSMLTTRLPSHPGRNKVADNSRFVPMNKLMNNPRREIFGIFARSVRVKLLLNAVAVSQRRRRLTCAATLARPAHTNRPSGRQRRYTKRLATDSSWSDVALVSGVKTDRRYYRLLGYTPSDTSRRGDQETEAPSQ